MQSHKWRRGKYWIRADDGATPGLSYTAKLKEGFLRGNKSVHLTGMTSFEPAGHGDVQSLYRPQRTA